MSAYDEISKAISVHHSWRQKLLEAIESGECDCTIESVTRDDNCSFGKWLRYRIEPSIKKTTDYIKIVDLHTQFHKEAGRILELALKGNKEQAINLINIEGKFAVLSKKPADKLEQWPENYHQKILNLKKSEEQIDVNE